MRLEIWHIVMWWWSLLWSGIDDLGLFHFIPSGSDQKVQVCKEYGADVAINYKTQDFAVEVLSATADRGISVLHVIFIYILYA